MNLHKPFCLICFFIFCLFVHQSQAQTQNQNQESIEDYKTDLSFGINVNSMSGWLGGVNFKHAKQIKPLQYRTLFFEFVNIKHAKEDSKVGNSSGGGETYTPGKLNYLTFLRSHYGREIVLFRPAKEQGVQINFIGSAGMTIGFEVPYYIELVNNGAIFVERYNPNNANHTFDRITRSRGIFGEGLQEMQFIYGASAKIALAFRFNAFRNTAIGLEGGTMIDYMNRKTQIMVGGEDKQLYHTFFLTLFYAIQTR